MAKKGYLVSAYRSIKDPDKLAAYAKLAGPAFSKFGARYVARDTAAQAYEAGIKQRIVIVEFAERGARRSPPMTARTTRRRSRCSATPPSATCASSKGWSSGRPKFASSCPRLPRASTSFVPLAFMPLATKTLMPATSASRP